MGRYGSNIRRIAQTDELNERIRQAEQRLSVLDKSQIPGARAIAYVSGGVQTGAPGATNPDQNGSPDDSGIFPTNDPLNSNGIDDSTIDGDSLIDGTKQLQPGEDPGAIQLKDCDSGERIDVRFNTGSNEGEAKFKHPDGWEVDGPGIDSSYLAGSVWYTFAGANVYISNNFDGMVSAFQAGESYTYCYTIEGGLVSKLSPDAGDALIQFTNTVRVIGQAPSGGTQRAYTSSTSSVSTGQYGRVLCGTYAGDTAACSAEPPMLYNNWQEAVPGTPHQLAFSAQDGGFVSSSYDDGMPLKFSNEVGSGRGLNNMNLCTPDGEEVVVSALSDGTFAYFKEDGFGNPATDAKILHFDNAGKYKDLLREDEFEYLKTTSL